MGQMSVLFKSLQLQQLRNTKSTHSFQSLTLQDALHSHLSCSRNISKKNFTFSVSSLRRINILSYYEFYYFFIFLNIESKLFGL